MANAVKTLPEESPQEGQVNWKGGDGHLAQLSL